MLFEFSDASGMSYRTTGRLKAAVAYSDGGEGSTIEIDPLAGGGVVYWQEYPELQLFNTHEEGSALEFSLGARRSRAES